MFFFLTFFNGRRVKLVTICPVGVGLSGYELVSMRIYQKWVLFICFRVASLRDAGILLLIITALRLTACTVLLISHPFGVINRGPIYAFFF